MMDWTNEPIYKANDRWGMRLEDDALARLYVRFFFFFVRGQQGWFNIAEHLGDVSSIDDAPDDIREAVGDRLIPLRIVSRSDPNQIQLEATIIFRNALFQSTVLTAARPFQSESDEGSTEIFSIGQSKLTDEQLLFESLPVKIDGPPGVFG